MSLTSNQNDTNWFPRIESFNVGLMVIVSGFVYKLGLVKIVDELLPKIGQHSLTNSQILKFLILRFLANDPTKGFCHLTEFANKYAVDTILGVDPDLDFAPEQCNDYVASRFLDSVYEFGSAEFSMKLFHAMLKAMDVIPHIKIIHADSTSMGSIWNLSMMSRS